jgi:lysozyme
VRPDLGKLVAQLKGFEGWRPNAYIDTKGYVTIGYGLNLGRLVLPPGVRHQDCRIAAVHGITPAIGEALLLREAMSAIEDLAAALPWVEQLDEVRHRVLADMAFNMGMGTVGGPHGLLSFVNTLKAVEEGRWVDAAIGMRHSGWYRDVGPGRAEPLIRMMETGEDRES